MHLSPEETTALRHVASTQGRAWRRILREARVEGRVDTLAADSGMTAILHRLLGRSGFRLDLVKLPREGQGEVTAVATDEEPPHIPIPLTPALATFRAGLEQRERAIFDARIAVRRPRLLRTVQAEMGLSVPSISRIEKAIRAQLEAAGIDPPTATYQDFDDFRAGLTAREKVIADTRIKASPPSMSFGDLEALLGVSRQRANQIAEALLLEAASGGLLFAKEAA